MISLNVLFWIFIILFAIIGLTRGWAKEVLVTFSLVVAIFLVTVLERYVGYVRDGLVSTGGAPLFWFRTIIILAMVFFAYQTPRIPNFVASGHFIRERFQDSLLGLFLGALNGFLIIGTLWFYLHAAEYPFGFITGPVAGTPLGDAAINLLKYLPPEWLTSPLIFFAVAICFVFVLVVFI